MRRVSELPASPCTSGHILREEDFTSAAQFHVHAGVLTTGLRGWFLRQGVLHAGAVLESGVIGSITAAGVRTEFSGKVQGAWNLIGGIGEAPLRALNLFSSLAAFSGSGGQGSYAAANAVLDSCAQTLQVLYSNFLSVKRLLEHKANLSTCRPIDSLQGYVTTAMRLSEESSNASHAILDCSCNVQRGCTDGVHAWKLLRGRPQGCSCLGQARGVLGTAVQWGAWGGSGMAVDVAGFMQRMTRMGLGVLSPAVGLSVLAQVLHSAWRPATTSQRALFVGAHSTSSSNPLVRSTLPF